MTENTIELLHKKYGAEIKIYPPISGTCKEVYVIEKDMQKFVVLVDRKNTYEHQHRFLRSNYMQRFLFTQGLPVAEVSDIFYLNKQRIAAKHSYIKGKNIENLNTKNAYTLGKIIAKIHLCSIEKFHPVYPFKYKIFDIYFNIKSFFRIKKLIHKDSFIKKLPLGICHHDLNLSNFIQAENEIFIIDFDRWHYWPFACELARFVRNKDFKQEIIDGYQSVRVLSEAEKQYISQKFPELKLSLN